MKNVVTFHLKIKIAKRHDDWYSIISATERSILLALQRMTKTWIKTFFNCIRTSVLLSDELIKIKSKGDPVKFTIKVKRKINNKHIFSSKNTKNYSVDVKGGWLRLKGSSQSTAVGRMSGRAGEGQECMLCLSLE